MKYFERALDIKGSQREPHTLTQLCWNQCDKDRMWELLQELWIGVAYCFCLSQQTTMVLILSLYADWTIGNITYEYNFQIVSSYFCFDLTIS